MNGPSVQGSTRGASLYKYTRDEFEIIGHWEELLGWVINYAVQIGRKAEER